MAPAFLIICRVDDPRDRLYWMISGFRTTQLVRTAALLGVCDQLAEGPLTAAEVASRVEADSDIVHRILRALTAFGVFVESPDGRFTNGALGDLLRKDDPGGLRNVALGLTGDLWYDAWGKLLRGTREGRTPFELAHGGKSFWQLMESDPDVKAEFNRFMVTQTEAFAPQLLAAFDFSGLTKVLDVGGGNGALVGSVLAAHPSLQGTILDLETGLQGADKYLAGRGVRERCELVTGNFFESVPEHHDAYLMRYVLHDWDDGRAAEILATCRRSMRPGAWLLVIDQLLPRTASERVEDRFALTLDLHMYVLFGARERTEENLRGLLAGAGFEVERVVPTRPAATIVARAL